MEQDIAQTPPPKQTPQTPQSSPVPKGKSNWSDLAARVVSGVILAISAFAVTWYGGLAFALFFGGAALLIYKEWVGIVGESLSGIPAVVGYASILLSLVCLLAGAWQAALIIPLIGAGFLFFARCSYPYARWCGSGLLYAAAFGLAMIGLRDDATLGFSAILILFAVVWGTDVAAYFAGKSIGGPKLWPRISPKKTWSGSLGGLVVGTAFALFIAYLLGVQLTVKLAILLAALSVLSQIGDLAESHMKRLFDVKDSSNLIPGHGGVMDRVDGLLFAAVAAALIGVVFGDAHHLATGFLVW